MAQPSVTVFTSFLWSDLWYLAEAAGRTMLISTISVFLGSVLGCLFGCLLYSSMLVRVTLGLILDIFRSVPLIIQLILFFNFFPMLGWYLDPFYAGTFVLTLYSAALIANVTLGGIEAVGLPMRRAARSLGMSYWQDMRYVVWPIGLRAVFPAWVGVALGVMKDSALVSVLGYLELLKASQNLITRTQEPFIILSIAGTFYFVLSYPISKLSARIEARWQS